MVEGQNGGPQDRDGTEIAEFLLRRYVADMPPFAQAFGFVRDVLANLAEGVWPLDAALGEACGDRIEWDGIALTFPSINRCADIARNSARAWIVRDMEVAGLLMNNTRLRRAESLLASHDDGTFGKQKVQRGGDRIETLDDLFASDEVSVG
jgi:hypothetical protein